MNIKKNNIGVVMTSDNNYAQHLGVALKSINDNLDSSTLLDVRIIENNILEKNKTKIEKVLSSEHNISFLPFDISNREMYPINVHVSSVTYYRIFLPEIIEDSVKKVIYLDPDIIVQGDISELWRVDVENWHLAAVKDYGFSRHEDLKIPKGSDYFNSGVMLINLERWRRDNIKTKTLDYIFHNADTIKLWDQDALNAILHDKWKKLNPKWNLQYNMLKGSIREDKDILRAAVSDPEIIHYTSTNKPWEYSCLHPEKELYYEYIKKTPWKNYKARITIIGVLKKVAKIFFIITPSPAKKYFKGVYLYLKRFF